MEIFLAYIAYKHEQQYRGHPIEYDFWDFRRHWLAYNNEPRN